MKRAILLFGFFFLTVTAYGQNNGASSKKDTKEINEIRLDEERTKNLLPVKKTISKNKIDIDKYFTPVNEWITVTGVDPRFNFNYYSIPIPAGDINGDGYDDYVKSGYGKDERTAYTGDDELKTGVFFGGESLSETNPDQLFYNELHPIDDINGDGYSDAITLDVLSSSKEVNILLGSSNGFIESDIQLNFPLVSERLDRREVKGFADLNGDGFYYLFKCIVFIPRKY